MYCKVYLQFDGSFFGRMITSGSSTHTTGGKLVGGRGVEDWGVAVPGFNSSGFSSAPFAAGGGWGISDRPWRRNFTSSTLALFLCLLMTL